MSDVNNLIHNAQQLMMTVCEEIHSQAQASGLTVDQAAKHLRTAGHPGIAIEYQAWAEVWA